MDRRVGDWERGADAGRWLGGADGGTVWAAYTSGGGWTGTARLGDGPGGGLRDGDRQRRLACQRVGGRAFRVLDRDVQEAAAGLDPVAVLEVGAGDAPAVDVGAVAAAQIEQPALGRVQLHQEVQPRDAPILARQTEVRPLGTAHDKGIMAVEREGPPLVRSFNDGEGDAHGILAGGRWLFTAAELWDTLSSKVFPGSSSDRMPTRFCTGMRLSEPKASARGRAR